MPSISPGPNVYELPQIIGAGTHDPRFPYAPAYSLSPRIAGGATDSGPGPNTYDLANVYRDGKNDPKAFAMGGRQGAQSKDLMPGPGQYEPLKAEKIVYKTLPSYGFGGKEHAPRQDASPAPGQYDPKIADNVKTFAMRGRPHSRRNDNSPGPGTYEITPRVLKDGVVGGPEVKITGRGKDFSSSMTPAPGQYEMEKGFNATRPGLPTYSFKGKGREFVASDTPGPTAYNPRAPASKRSITMGGRDKDWRGSETPGPGQYDFDNHVYRTGKEGGKVIVLRGRPRDATHASGLGPGSYMPDFTSTQVRPPNYTMGGKGDFKSGDLTPGPGHYDPKDLKKNNGFNFRGRPDDSGRNGSPGPGEYEINDKVYHKGRLGGPAYTIGGRDDLVQTNGVPGPGHYQPIDAATKAKQPAYSFTPRGEWNTADGVPGPGQYSPRDGTGGPSFNMRGRPKDGGVGKSPGPGEYEVTDKLYNQGKLKTPAFTMGKKDAGNRTNTYPGPGHYDPKDRKAGPQWSLGARQDYANRDGSPGPGHYDPKENRNMKALSMDATSTDRRSMLGNNNPGPGYYQVDNNVYDKMGRRQPAFSMGGRQPAKFGSDTPGPGHYLPDIQKDGRSSTLPAYTMGGKGKEMTSDNPGKSDTMGLILCISL